MSQLNTHIQVGRVGQLKEVGANLVVTVCSNNPYKNGNGEWIDNPEWIEHTIFARQDSRIKWAREKLESGDLVQITSRPKQTEWKVANGERRFGYTFAVEDIQRLAEKPAKKAEAPAAKPQGKKAR
jgi:single-stranded DNA-binding protein